MAMHTLTLLDGREVDINTDHIVSRSKETCTKHGEHYIYVMENRDVLYSLECVDGTSGSGGGGGEGKIYKAGNGLVLDEVNNIFSVKLVEDGGLFVDKNGLKVNDDTIQSTVEAIIETESADPSSNISQAIAAAAGETKQSIERSSSMTVVGEGENQSIEVNTIPETATEPGAISIESIFNTSFV